MGEKYKESKEKSYQSGKKLKYNIVIIDPERCKGCQYG